uniref:2OG-Fe(II) oxygenase n=1 Tax=Parerythrobacter lutipelagi TaxID=1964208 RepID=UPI0010F649DA|nr:2OG-Fe(II) oxygenase family protein [Parerythrobacter lutipelagi]
MAKALFELNPDLDRDALAQQFARNKRVQIRDLLTRETAEEIRLILANHTPWGLAFKAGEGPGIEPQQVLAQEGKTPEGQQKLQQLFKTTDQAAAAGDYAFRYGQFSLVQNVQEQWDPGGPHELLLEYLNAEEFLDLVREITRIPGLVKADGQATLYASNHFLATHNDSHVAEGWRIAYVMNFTIDDWKRDWGGYLVFFDEDGDIIEGYRPRFNALNMFLVPQSHAVQYVPPFAPMGRLAITGWFRDR